MKRFALLMIVPFIMMPHFAHAKATLTGNYSDAELVQIFKKDGYSEVEKIRDGLINVKVDGRSFVLMNRKDGDLQLYYGATGVEVDHSDMNEWNRTRRLSRAYLNSDQEPVLEWDLVSNGGLTKKHVTEFLRIFVYSATAFRKFLLEHHDR